MSLDDIKQPMDQENDTVSAESLEESFSAFAEVTHVEKKPEKNRRFSKRVTTIIAASVAAVALAVALLIVTLLPHGEEPISTSEGTTQVDTSVKLLDKSVKDKASITRLDISNKEGKYTILYNETEKIYQLVGYEDLLISKDLINTVVSYATKVTAADQIKKPKKLSVYGLENPTATATVTYHDGSTCTFYIGDETPSESGYYVYLEGIDGIYIFEPDAVTGFTVIAAAYVDTTLISAPTVKSDDTEGTSIMKEISYTGKQYPMPLHIRRSFHTDPEEMTYYSYIITEPYLRGTSDETTSIYTNFTSLSAVQALIVHPTEDQNIRAGITDPLSVIKVTMAVETPDESDTSSTEDAEINKYYNETISTITIGSKDEDGNYIVMVDGIDAIFLVSSDAFATVAERNYTNSVNTLLFAKNLTKINRIAIQTADVSCDLTLTHLDDVDEDEENMIVSQGSNEYSAPEFRELYTLMMSIMRYDAWEEEPTNEKSLSIQLYNADGSLFLAADFFSISGSRYGVRTTEGEQFTTRSAEVNHFIKQIVNYLNGEDVNILT